MSYASSEGSSLIPSFILPPSISVNTISPIAPSTTVNFTGSGGITADEFVGASVISTTVDGIILPQIHYLLQVMLILALLVALMV